MSTPRDDTERQHERFGEWDAAYLLGALTPADRRAYEDHIAGCRICGTAVVELAGVPALLGTLPREQAPTLVEPEAAAESGEAASSAALPTTSVETDLVPTLLGRVRRIRRRRRWIGRASCRERV